MRSPCVAILAQNINSKPKNKVSPTEVLRTKTHFSHIMFRPYNAMPALPPDSGRRNVPIKYPRPIHNGACAWGGESSFYMHRTLQSIHGLESVSREEIIQLTKKKKAKGSSCCDFQGNVHRLAYGRFSGIAQRYKKLFLYFWVLGITIIQKQCWKGVEFCATVFMRSSNNAIKTYVCRSRCS